MVCAAETVHLFAPMVRAQLTHESSYVIDVIEFRLVSFIIVPIRDHRYRSLSKTLQQCCKCHKSSRRGRGVLLVATHT